MSLQKNAKNFIIYPADKKSLFGSGRQPGAAGPTGTLRLGVVNETPPTPATSPCPWHRMHASVDPGTEARDATRKSSNTLSRASQSWASAGASRPKHSGYLTCGALATSKLSAAVLRPLPGPGPLPLSRAGPSRVAEARPWGQLPPFARGTEKTGICRAPTAETQQNPFPNQLRSED